MSAVTQGKHRNPTVDEAWLAKRVEPILEPDLPIIDPHHHLGFEGTPLQYLVPDVLNDMNSGHHFVGSVFSDCEVHHRTDGPEHLRPVGETEFVATEAETYAKAHPDAIKVCSGIISTADLTLGERVREVLEAHITAGRGRFRGIRGHTHNDAEEMVGGKNWPDRMLYEPRVREAIACLAPLSLTYDAWLFHPQIPHLVDLARAQPQTTIVLVHCGGPLGTGRWAGKADEVFPVWKAAMEELARCDNVYVKVGGLGTVTAGYTLWDREIPLSSEELAQEWSRWITPSIQMFGPERCMFQSNFPIDKRTTSSAVLWNAFKRLAAGYSADEKAALFAGSARKAYRLP